MIDIEVGNSHLLSTWTQTRMEIAAEVLARCWSWSKRHAGPGTATLADGAVLSVWVGPDGSEFYETIGGRFTDGKRWRMEARNRQSALCLILPHLDEVCSLCGGTGLAQEEVDCPACDGLGVRPGSEAYQARLARINAMRRKVEGLPL